MNFVTVPTLEHRTLVKITTVLWNQDDLRIMVAKFHSSSDAVFIDTRKEWREVENEVIKKVYKLPLPISLKNKLATFVEAVGWQILTWVDFHMERFVLKLPREFFWTPQGTIDKERTAKMMVHDQSFGDVVKRYKLSCTYSLEDHIPLLWAQLINEEFYQNDAKKMRISEMPLVSFWTWYVDNYCRVDGNRASWNKNCPDAPFECNVKVSAGCGNLASTKYFFRKLTAEDQERVLLPAARLAAEHRCSCDIEPADFPKESYTEVLCFLLSLMNEEQQTELFMSCPFKVLKCFLDWPWQDLFVEMADHIWEFLSDRDFKCLLMILVDRTINDFRDYDYQRLFGKFWLESPQIHKSSVINDPALGSLLSKLFEINDKENILLILNAGTVDERERVIFYFGSLNICSCLASRNRWEQLKFFVTACISSPTTMMRFKEVFKSFIVDFTTIDRQSCIDKFFRVLDHFIREDHNRKVLEDSKYPLKVLSGTDSEITDEEEK